MQMWLQSNLLTSHIPRCYITSTKYISIQDHLEFKNLSSQEQLWDIMQGMALGSLKTQTTLRSLKLTVRYQWMNPDNQYLFGSQWFSDRSFYFWPLFATCSKSWILITEASRLDSVMLLKEWSELSYGSLDSSKPPSPFLHQGSPNF